MKTSGLAAEAMMRMADSGVVVGLAGFVAAAIPAGGLSGTNFMEWKNPLRESGAK
jgi:hypothetical protein